MTLTLPLAIVLATIWMMPVAALFSRYVSSQGLFITWAVAIGMTIYLVR